MTSDDATATEPTMDRLRWIARGDDGEALVGADADGRSSECRVLTSISPPRLAEVRRQLALLRLADHASVRELVQPLGDDMPPAFCLAIPAGLDPLNDRLSRRMGDLQPVSRLQIAAQLVAVCESSHRVGLCHGSFAASTILIDDRKSPPLVFVDYSAVSCGDDVHDIDLSVDGDLDHLRRLFAELLKPILRTTDADELNDLNARGRAVLRQWTNTHANDHAGIPTPTLSQWRSVLDAFLPTTLMDQTLDFDSTGILVGNDSSSGSDGTRAMGTGEFGRTLVDDPSFKEIGRFRIESKIGEGGMGSVYRGVDPIDDAVVAIKVLHHTGKDVAQSIRRFRKEARLLQDVQNEHITRLIDVGEDDGRHYLVMEFVDGVDLKTWLAQRSALPEHQAIGLMIDLTRSLVDAHAREVVHRDIKPENVLLQRREDAPQRDGPMASRPIGDFKLKLSDFGIARHVHQSESLEMTRAGAVMGTPKYMSPEQCKSADDVGPTADVYSLGVTMFELLTGGVPYESDDFMKIATMHCFEPIPSAQKRNAQVTDSAERIVNRALAKAPVDRFGDASQMLTELLRLQRGDAAPWHAHPKLPQNLGERQVWEKTVTWELDSDRVDLWPLISNTERLNEAIGLPAVEYRTEQDPIAGTRRFGSFTVSGMKVDWEEHPYEWIEGRRMCVLREFSNGPLQWYMSIVTMEPLAGGGTSLSHQLRVQSRNWLGRIMITLKMDREGFRNLDRVYRRIDRSISVRLPTRPTPDAFTDPKPMSRSQATRLSRAIERIVHAGVDSDAAAKLEMAMQTWSSQELARMRPLAMADRLGVAGSVMVDACLLAAHEGILNLRWDVLCPTCRVSAETKDELSQIHSHTNCEACDVNFQSNLSDAIEMVFQAHPEIRDSNSQKYCIGGPVHSPHVVAQVRVEAGEPLEVQLDLGVGNYLVRGPRLPRTQNVIVQSTAAPSRLDWSLSHFGSSNHTPTLRAGRQTITITNDCDTPHMIRFERTIPRGDVVTAAMASTQPLFRKLFPTQRFREDNPIATQTMTFLTTGINNIDQLYNRLGDTHAYAAVHRLNAEISICVGGAGGTVVNTIGERLLAAFASRENAVIAAIRIRELVGRSAELMPQLGIGVHGGPTLVTTQNNQLDYFGRTVRAASGLPDLAGGDTLITEAVYADASVRDYLDGADNVITILDLPGHPRMRILRIVTQENASTGHGSASSQNQRMDPADRNDERV